MPVLFNSQNSNNVTQKHIHYSSEWNVKTRCIVRLGKYSYKSLLVDSIASLRTKNSRDCVDNLPKPLH